MDIERVSNVPSVTWESVCFSRTIRDQPMKGVSTKSSKITGCCGKMKSSVVKSKVEYVMCPDIFQKSVMSVIMDDTTKRFKDMVVTVGSPRVVDMRWSSPKSREMVMK